MSDKIHYEARLNRNIRRNPYGVWKTYKKGTVVEKFSKSEFEKMTEKNVDNYFTPCICEGHGVYEYFDMEKDIDFVKIETITETREVKMNLRKK